MKFSWRALLLAPLPIPLLISGGFAFMQLGGGHPFFAFLFFSAIGCILSYGTTLFLFLPCLFLVSRFKSLTWLVTGLVGTMLGFLVSFPITWEEYASSGVDSGPPEGTFIHFLLRNGFGWEFFIFVFAGLITSLLYWFLASLWCRRNDQVAA